MTKGWGFLGQLVTLATSGLVARTAILLVGFLIARHFGPEQFGQYSTAFALATLFLALANVGVSLRLMRATAQFETSLNIRYGNTMLVTGTLILVLYPVLIIVARLLGYGPQTRLLVLLLGPVVLLLALHEVYSAIAQGRNLIGLVSVYRATYGLSLLACVTLVMLLGWSLVMFCVIALVATAAVTLAWCWSTNRLVRPQIRLPQIPSQLKESYLYGLSALLFIIYFRIDVVMLSLMRTETEVGEYTAAYQVIEVLMKAPVLISFVTLPLAFSAARNPTRMMQIYRAKVRWLGLMGAGATLGTFLLAGPIVELAVGGQYRLAPEALRVLSGVFILKFLAMAAGDTLTALDRQGIRTGIQGLTALLNVVLNLLLIPRHGALGAAWATVISELALTGGYYSGIAVVWGTHGTGAIITRVLGCLFCSATSAAVAEHWLGGYGAITVGLLVLAGASYALGLLRWTDLQVLSKTHEPALPETND